MALGTARLDIQSELLRGLSDEGRDIVRSTKDRLLVVAGAGAGKTEAMARRIAWWHAVDGVPKDQIVAFTFTERAAEEMKFRVRRYMSVVSPDGDDPSLGGMYVGTIHSYCINTLRKLWPEEFHNAEIVDEVARYALIQQGYYPVLGLSALAKARTTGNFPKSRSDTIEYFLRAYDLLNEYNRLEVVLPRDALPPFGQESEWCKNARLRKLVGNDDTAKAFSQSAARYYAYLRCRHFLDFSTSQAELVRRLAADPVTLNELRSMTTHVVIDEVQDVNVVQDELRKLLVGTSGHLTAVGDHRQAIYGFRGGRIDLMANLAAELTADPDGAVMELTANYRSTPRIISLSNEWNRTILPPGTMTSPDMSAGRESRTDKEPTHVMCSRFDTRIDEADWIASSIGELVQGGKGAVHDDRDGRRGITYSDIAVLVRSSTDARTFQTALQDAGVPAVVRAGPDLFAQPEVLLFAAALSLTAKGTTFMGATWDRRSLPRRIQDELHCSPQPAEVVRAAYRRLAGEGLPIRRGSAERLIKVAEAIASRIYRAEAPSRVRTPRIHTPELRQFLRAKGDVRRVFPQTLLQYLMAEGGVSSWDTETPRGRMAMFHLGQLSSLVTGMETPGWTSPPSYQYQVSSLLMWGSRQASPEEAPLLVAPDAVTVSTIHSCKGLEFAAVFVADVVSRRFPSQFARRVPDLPYRPGLRIQLATDLLADNVNLDGERRLMYVAITRAERYLFVTSSKPSPFFTELETLCDMVGGTVADQTPVTPHIQLRKSKASHESRLVTSFSDLRYFLECPHDFYLRKVLGFTPTIDQAFGYGRGVHNLMRQVHLEPSKWSNLAHDRPALEAELHKLIDRGMFYLRHTTGEPARLMHEKGIQIVADYVTSYGDELARLTYEPEREFEVLLPEENVLITGAIDVVRRDDPPRVTIIDFKSGDADSDSHQSLDHEEMRMQVSIYAVAAKQELQYEPDQGLVRYLGEPDDQKRELTVPLTPSTIVSSREQVARLAADIQARKFRRTPARRADSKPKERCDRCDFKSLCSISLAS